MTDELNEIEREQLCATASDCIRHGVGRLANFPGLLKKIIETRAWERRKIRTGKIVELSSLAELITKKPLEGWGEDPKKVEAVIKDDAEVLTLFREAMKDQTHDRGNQHTGGKNNNVMIANDVVQGNSKAYTVSRLKRESPELYQQVCKGELSANAAAIQAGFRKKSTPEETCIKAFKKSGNKLVLVHRILKELDESTLSVVRAEFLG